MKQPTMCSPFKTCLHATALAGGLLFSAFSSADLMNGDFSSGFASWQGEVTDDFFVNTFVDPLPGAFGGNYDASSGAAVLTNDDTNIGIALFQDFTVQSLLASGNTLWLDLDFSASVSDPFDLVIGELENPTGPLLSLDLTLGGGPIDITAWAGIDAGIVFYLEDGDFFTGDFLTIDNISITQRTAAVPEPASLMLLLGAGLGLLASQRKRRA